MSETPAGGRVLKHTFYLWGEPKIKYVKKYIKKRCEVVSRVLNRCSS